MEGADYLFFLGCKIPKELMIIVMLNSLIFKRKLILRNEDIQLHCRGKVLIYQLSVFVVGIDFHFREESSRHLLLVSIIEYEI